MSVGKKNFGTAFPEATSTGRNGEQKIIKDNDNKRIPYYKLLEEEDKELFYQQFLVEHKQYAWFYIQDGLMFCTECDPHYRKGSKDYRFAGSDNYQNGTLSSHQKTQSHSNAVIKNIERRINDKKIWRNALPSIVDLSYTNLFSNMYYLAKNNIALRQFETLNKHTKDLGISIPNTNWSNKSGSSILLSFGHCI